MTMFFRVLVVVLYNVALWAYWLAELVPTYRQASGGWEFSRGDVLRMMVTPSLLFTAALVIIVVLLR